MAEEKSAVTMPEHSLPRWGTTTKVLVVATLLILLGIAAYVFRVIWLPLIIGAIMAFILYPVADFFHRLTHLPHTIATLLVYLILIALLVPIGFGLGPMIAEQALLAKDQALTFIQYLNVASADTLEIMGYTIVIGDIVRQVTSDLTAMVTSVATGSVGLVMDAARMGFMVIVTFVVGFYLTRDVDRVIAGFKALVPPEYQDDTETLLDHLNHVWGAFFRGQLTLSLTVTVILTLVSAILGLPQPLLLGLWGGLLEFLPSIGHTLWGATVLLVAAFQGSTYLPLPHLAFVLVVLGAYLAFTQLDLNILIPNILGGQMEMHPMVILIGIILGASIGGVVGMALAAPMIASLRVLGKYVYAKLFDLDPFPEEE